MLRFSDNVHSENKEAGPTSQLKWLNFNVCGLKSKLSDADCVNNVSTYDFASMTETFMAN